MRRWIGLLVLATAVTWVLPVQADDRADLEGTKIIGSRELPKVLYIVPWRPPQSGELAGRPVESLMDEALAPVDREVFQRQVEYHSHMQSTRAAGGR